MIKNKKKLMQNLSKYECTRIIGLRALEIQNGATHLFEVKDVRLAIDSIYVAAKELSEGLLDFKINRRFPMNVTEQISSENYSVHSDVYTLIYTKENC